MKTTCALVLTLILPLLACCATGAHAEDFAWSLRDVSGGRAYWRGAGLSNDGSTVALAARFDTVYTSTNSGTTLTQRSPAGVGVATSALSWYAVAVSSDGSKLVTCADADYVYTSTDGGATWTKREPSGTTTRSWRSVAISADGTVMAACATGNYVYISTDSGANWTQCTPAGAGVTKSWLGVALSSDGTKVAACADNDYIYTSTDSGANWTKREPAGAGVTRRWFSVTMSSDGTKLAGAIFGNYVYTSTDSGANWTQRTPAGAGVTKNWYSISSSSDGTKLAVCAESDYIYVSTDSGANWTQRQPAGAGVTASWHSVALSPDGSKLVTSGDGGYTGSAYISSDDGANWVKLQPPNINMRVNGIGLSLDGGKAVASLEQTGHPVYVSVDGGSTWTSYEPASPTINLAWRGAAVAADGSLMAVAASGNYVYTSTDDGANWTKREPAGVGVTRSWRAVSVSSDGSFVAACAQGDYVYTSTDSGASWTKREPAGAGVTKSWQSVMVTPDGTKLIASAANDYVYTSTDSGATWTKREPAGAGVPKIFYAVDLSSDGTKMVASADQSTPGGDYIYTSTDSGASWTKREPAGAGNGKFWLGVSMSDDGAKIAGAPWGDFVYTSSDGGATWAKQEINGPGAAEKMYGASFSGDGSKLGIAAQHIYIGTAQASGPVVTCTGTAQTHTEGGAATAVDPGVTVTSSDAGLLIKSATVTIASNFQSGSDTLSLTDANCNGVFSGATLTITPKSPATELSMADFQAALRAVKFSVSSDNPSTAQRGIAFQAVSADDEDSNVSTQPLNVAASNDAPTATGQSVSTTEDTAKAITLSGSDPEGSLLTYIIVSGPSHGSLSGSGANRTYTPTTDYTGSDSFTFKVNDGALDSGTATVSISISPENDLPTIAITSPVDGATIHTGGSISITVATADADGTVTKVEFFSGATKLGESTVSPFTFSWSNPSAGAHALTARATDNDNGITTSATVNITVNARPLPAFSATPQTGILPLNVAFNASASTDPDGSIISYAWDFGDGQTATGVTTSHIYTVQGIYTATLTITDNRGASASEVKTITVNPIPPLTAPSNLRVSVAQNYGFLVWQDNSTTEHGFYIERRYGTGGWTRIGTVGANTTSFQDPFSMRGAEYRVQAFKSAEVSAYSNISSGGIVTFARDPNLRW